MEDEVEPDAVCSEQADETAVSFSSDGALTVNMVSCGLNLSMMDWKWTETRAVAWRMSIGLYGSGTGVTAGQ